MPENSSISDSTTPMADSMLMKVASSATSTRLSSTAMSVVTLYGIVA